jgi:hypothetical protein
MPRSVLPDPRAEQWRERALGLRARARTLHNPGAARNLENLADEIDEFADRLDGGKSLAQ